MNATFFANQAEFRKWFEKHHKSEKELLVGFYKVSSNKPSISWSESVDHALCFGWIDGIRKSIDHESYCIRFTPRRKNSIWSDVNIKKVEELTNSGLMTEEGLKAFSYRKDNKSGIYSHENGYAVFDNNTETLFQQHKTAWDFFSKQAPSYKKVISHWIMSAKQEKTRLTRLEKTIRASEQHSRIF